MKPAPFAYADPDSIEEVCALLAEAGDDAAVIAGGQSLVPLLNLRLARPELVIDLRRVPGLGAFRLDADGLHAGAMARASAVEHDPAAPDLPGLVAALHHVGHPQIRNRTTFGGSLAHADPAAELPALLLALDGTVTLTAATGARVVPADEFLAGPFMTSRRSDEVVTAAHFPRFRGRVIVTEAARRPGDFAMAGVVVAVAGAEPVVDTRVVVFGVSGRPRRVAGAETALVGRRLDDDAVTSAVAAVRAGVNPTGDVHASADYRRHVAGELVRRALEQLRSQP